MVHQAHSTFGLQERSQSKQIRPIKNVHFHFFLNVGFCTNVVTQTMSESPQAAEASTPLMSEQRPLLRDAAMDMPTGFAKRVRMAPVLLAGEGSCAAGQIQKDTFLHVSSQFALQRSWPHCSFAPMLREEMALV